MITEDNRLDVVDKLFNELYKIGNNLNVAKQVPEVIERLTHLEKEGISVTYPTDESAEDTSNSFVLINNYLEAHDNNIDENSQLMFYPMFSKDAQYGQAANYYVQRVSGAAYGPESNMIIMNMSLPKKETPRFWAHSFIHELGHAQVAKKEGRLFKKNLRSQGERLQEEINMWTIDYKLMLALGGKKYQKASKKMACEINRWWCHKRERPCHQGTGIALKYCWGNLLDTDSNNERDLSFFSYCALMAADYYFNKEEAKEIKLQITQEGLIKEYNIENNLIEIFSNL